MISRAVTELEEKLLKLQKISYKNIDTLMRKIMKSYDITAKELHNAFKQKHKKTPDDWIQEKMKKLQEDHKELQSGKMVDDEGYMARNQLNQIETSVKKLKKIIDSPQYQLPSWVQSKITLAADYINSVSNYMESDENVKESAISKTKVSVMSKIHPENKNLRDIDKEKNYTNPKEQVENPLTISLVEKILGEEKCGKGMYWCNTDQVCKPIPKGMKVPGQKVKPTEVGIGKPVAECSHTHIGEDCPVHGKKECPSGDQKNESNIVRDANGNPYVEFIDLISAGSIKEENPCWKTHKKVGMKKKGNRMVNDCVPIKEESVDEAVRMPAQTGNNIFVTLSWRGKYYSIQLFFPQAKIPSRLDITDEIQKIYPNSRVVTYKVAEFKQGEPLIYAYKGGSGGKLGPNKNYVKPMGEEVEIEEENKVETPREKLVTDRNMFNIPKDEQKAARERVLAKAAALRKKREMKEEVEMTEAGDWWHPDPDKDRTLSGRGPAVRTREDGVRPKLSKLSVKSSNPKKLRPGESYMEYAKRMKSMREGVEILDEKK
jgi:hypothetical protein